MQDDTLAFIKHIITERSIARILELGGGFGFGTIRLADISQADIISIEIDHDRCDMAKKQVEAAHYSARVQVIEGDALTIDPLPLGKFGLIIIDAAKTKYQRLFEHYAPILENGGVMLSDNVLFRGQVQHPETILSRNRRQLVQKITRYNEWLTHLEHYETTFYDIGDGIAVSIKKE
ncbi:MAG: methyltransferase domain-containing protein [Candidatus Izemoplasmatales bacterium]|nr:methyltransferase domain-containing protein [Candidatus Izemoplasmatales bacterium]MDD5294271.1 methyltransferase domain-containing protein [Candidatus Izemoplasmatales bacterium]